MERPQFRSPFHSPYQSLLSHKSSTMHYKLYVSAFIAPVAIIAAPTRVDGGLKTLTRRQSSLVKPIPCVRDNLTPELQTKAQSKAFTKAFIFVQEIAAAFKHIVLD